MKIITFILFSLLALVVNASEPDLKSQFASDRARMGASNVGYRTTGNPAELCQTMKSVGLGCSYNERGGLVQFLHDNGVKLFPCAGGTNPYTVGRCNDIGFGSPDRYNYIGQPVQNKMLNDAIKKNRALFKGGNLLASDAKKWK